MRLNFIEMCGFRGFRDRVRIDFAEGFTVISGRNGVGKSTVFDSVEFALTGKIDKYIIERTAMESVHDYLWWRGDGKPEAYYVSVGFIRGNGSEFTVTRTRESGSDTSRADIEGALCSGSPPKNAIHQLCKTSIIRDEWITALSVDLPETERFRQVSSALGPLESFGFGDKAKEVLECANAANEQHKKTYSDLRAKLAESLSRLSDLRNAMAHTGDIHTANKLLEGEIRDATGSTLVERLAIGREALARRRTKLNELSEILQEGWKLAVLKQKFYAPEVRMARESAQRALQTATSEKSDAEQAVSRAKAKLAREQEIDDIANSLSLLVEHGEKLGLDGDSCPLCAAKRTSNEFEIGVSKARKRIKSIASSVATAQKDLADARNSAKHALVAYDDAHNKWKEDEAERVWLDDREKTYTNLLKRFDLNSGVSENPQELEKAVEVERNRLVNLERAILTLEASQAVSKTVDLEEQIATLRNEIDVAAQAVERSERAVESARTIDRAVKRVGAEIVDERLAQISPLLNELYQRLRPHPDWRNIEYYIRGDVRRFLSLKVGNGLNPQFVLSSGQRRVVGLAFLLSVHLARAWTSWRTLLLDDPIQHIDDYRALHFVEILAAMHLDERQLVCAVEDQALAGLLTRRLSNHTEHWGRRYDLAINAEGVAVVDAKQDISPLRAFALYRREGTQTAS